MSIWTFRPSRERAIALLIASLSLPVAVQADSWGPPEHRIAVAADGSTRVAMTPGPVWPRQPAGTPERDAQPRARVERLVDGRWETLWDGRLVNDVAPLALVVAPRGGRMVTFDNWSSMGYGEDAIVIYDERGDVVRAWALDALLAPAHYETMPRSVSSLWWRGDPWISVDGRRVVVPLIVPQAYAPPTRPSLRPGLRSIDLELDLVSGQALPMDSPAWQSVRTTTGLAQIQRRAAQAARERWFGNPLSAPDGASIRAWEDYLREAYLRLDPRWGRDHPRVLVFEPRRPDARAAGLGELRAEIGHTRDVLVLGSPDPGLLHDVLVNYFAGARAGGLPGLRVYVAIDAKRGADIAAALAHTGATFHRIELRTPIAQRPERLYLWNRRARGD